VNFLQGPVELSTNGEASLKLGYQALASPQGHPNSFFCAKVDPSLVL